MFLRKSRKYCCRENPVDQRACKSGPPYAEIGAVPAEGHQMSAGGSRTAQGFSLAHGHQRLGWYRQSATPRVLDVAIVSDSVATCPCANAESSSCGLNVRGHRSTFARAVSRSESALTAFISSPSACAFSFSSLGTRSSSDLAPCGAFEAFNGGRRSGTMAQVMRIMLGVSDLKAMVKGPSTVPWGAGTGVSSSRLSVFHVSLCREAMLQSQIVFVGCAARRIAAAADPLKTPNNHPLLRNVPQDTRQTPLHPGDFKLAH